MKRIPPVVPAIFCLLLGLMGGYHFSDHSDAASSASASVGKRILDMETVGQAAVTREPNPAIEVSPTSVEHLQTLERVRHKVSGQALVENLPRLFQSSYEISSALAALMELSGEEEYQLNDLMMASIDKLGKLEGRHAIHRPSVNGETTIHIPVFAVEGQALRDELLAKVDSELGPKRRAILEMHMLHDSGVLGNFGTEAITLSRPDFEETHKREDLITLKVGRTVTTASGEAKEILEDRAFFISNFKKRFGDIFELEAE